MNSDSFQLQTNSILHVPIQNYEQKFTFFVNNNEFHTSRLVADLLSPKISKYHHVEPTINEYTINTKYTGDFNKILQLTSFDNTEIDENEFLFFIEIIENLGNTTKTIKMNRVIKEEDLSQINSVELLRNHLKYPHFYSEEILHEINEIASNFFSLSDEEKQIIETFDIDIIDRIISNGNLQLSNEDELFEFIDNLYTKDSKYSVLYSRVIFKNVSKEKMREFTSKVYFEDITRDTWNSLSYRLCEEIERQSNDSKIKETSNRYKSQNEKHKGNKKNENEENNKPFKTISYENQSFDGLINYLCKNSDIKDEIDISCSSKNSDSRDPWYVIQYEDEKKVFCTSSGSDEWVCIEFKNHKIKPTSYTIKTGNDGDNIRNFCIEVSNDKEEWEIIDEQQDCSSLKVNYSVQTFPIAKEKQRECKYLKIRQTGPNWCEGKKLQFSCIEIYGDMF